MFTLDDLATLDNGKTWFSHVCAKNFLSVSENQLEQLERYVDDLLEWNKKINLISRRDEENVWRRHILGSTAFFRNYNLVRNAMAVDVGTGGGLPGIPIAILRPDMKVVLMDSIQKKMRAVNEIVADLKLTNATTLVGRAEELSRKRELQQKFDYVIARAVGPVNDIIRWSRAFLKTPTFPGSKANREGGRCETIPVGSFIILKGGDLREEIDQAMVKSKPRNITVTPIVIDGVGTDDLADKKLVVVQL